MRTFEPINTVPAYSALSLTNDRFNYSAFAVCSDGYDKPLSENRYTEFMIKGAPDVILDRDSALLDAYGRQEDRAFNFHYQSYGYYPHVCYDGMTGDLIEIQLRDRTQYSCTGVVGSLQPILDEYLNVYPEICSLLRGDSGFARPDLYKQCGENGTGYVIRLKDNGILCSKRGGMENFIKKSKSGFDFASVSSRTRMVNANRLQVHALAYNIFSWFRRLALPANMQEQRIDTVRLKLLKIAAKVIHSARYITFKPCSSSPYRDTFKYR